MLSMHWALGRDLALLNMWSDLLCMQLAAAICWRRDALPGCSARPCPYFLAGGAGDGGVRAAAHRLHGRRVRWSGGGEEGTLGVRARSTPGRCGAGPCCVPSAQCICTQRISFCLPDGKS